MPEERPVASRKRVVQDQLQKRPRDIESSGHNRSYSSALGFLELVTTADGGLDVCTKCEAVRQSSQPCKNNVEYLVVLVLLCRCVGTEYICT